MNETPYATDHRASVERRLSPGPSGLRGLVTWFVARWREEVPDELHARGVEWDGPGRIVRADGEGVTDPGGGSLLGDPRLSPAFRFYLYGSPFAVEHPESEGVPEVGVTYSSPLRATIAWLEPKHPLKAAWLRAIGRRDGDWRGVATDAGFPEELGESITRDALGLAFRHYEEGPRAR